MITGHPTVALWLLERCKPGSCRDALIGDLLEEIAQGRSRLWIWQQVLAFCGFAFVDRLRDHRPAAPVIALGLAVVLVGGLWVAPSGTVLGAYGVLYFIAGTCSLLGDVVSRAFDSRPILFS